MLSEAADKKRSSVVSFGWNVAHGLMVERTRVIEASKRSIHRLYERRILQTTASPTGTWEPPRVCSSSFLPPSPCICRAAGSGGQRFDLPRGDGRVDGVDAL
jgi:hypothetical protein